MSMAQSSYIRTVGNAYFSLVLCILLTKKSFQNQDWWTWSVIAAWNVVFSCPVSVTLSLVCYNEPCFDDPVLQIKWHCIKWSTIYICTYWLYCVFSVKSHFYSSGIYTRHERAIVHATQHKFREILIVFYVWWVNGSYQQFMDFVVQCNMKSLMHNIYTYIRVKENSATVGKEDNCDTKQYLN